ncbi:hypothetical protein PVAP13_1KG095477 [Panicum virgatum]|uniref:Uncharacterized protein n=1 Tax=Panicum virgatum TaxID=38727 RepID=A0A8T0X4U2_PANVG|nr:hypothetical protein PVAP13_1KG095477 [Panicum virgatum]
MHFPRRRPPPGAAPPTAAGSRRSARIHETYYLIDAPGGTAVSLPQEGNLTPESLAPESRSARKA